MRVISYSEARNSLKTVLDKVVNDVDVTIINRCDAANAAHLAESVAQLKTGKASIKNNQANQYDD